MNPLTGIPLTGMVPPMAPWGEVHAIPVEPVEIRHTNRTGWEFRQDPFSSFGGSVDWHRSALGLWEHIWKARDGRWCCSITASTKYEADPGLLVTVQSDAPTILRAVRQARRLAALIAPVVPAEVAPRPGGRSR